MGNKSSVPYRALSETRLFVAKLQRDEHAAVGFGEEDALGAVIEADDGAAFLYNTIYILWHLEMNLRIVPSLVSYVSNRKIIEFLCLLTFLFLFFLLFFLISRLASEIRTLLEQRLPHASEGNLHLRHKAIICSLHRGEIVCED